MNRYLTTTERLFLAMAEQVVMNPVVLVRCRGSLSLAQVEHALRVVQKRHPALQVKLVRDSSPWFSDRDVARSPFARSSDAPTRLGGRSSATSSARPWMSSAAR
ncbi:MAG: hypothetical protein HC927_02770 [Deltaproteobacteria bacterium]|nr:hypothetical protein [Deltaproteobacteria bacterium]